LPRGWRRSPATAVLDEVATLCRDYKITNVIADQFSFTFLAELFRLRKIGLAQLNFTVSRKSRSICTVHEAIGIANRNDGRVIHHDAFRLGEQQRVGGALRLQASFVLPNRLGQAFHSPIVHCVFAAIELAYYNFCRDSSTICSSIRCRKENSPLLARATSACMAFPQFQTHIKFAVAT
jgi:hypothetical protein